MKGDWRKRSWCESKAEAVPSKKEVEVYNLDHATFRNWHPRCVKGRAEAYGHKKRKAEGGAVPTVSLDYMCMHREQEKEEEKGMPIIAVKDDETKLVMAKVVPGKGVQEYVVEVVRKFVEQLGYNKVIMKSDNEPAILALKEAGRRETSIDCHGRVTCGRSLGERVGGECGPERAVPVPGIEERAG